MTGNRRELPRSKVAGHRRAVPHGTGEGVGCANSVGVDLAGCLAERAVRPLAGRPTESKLVCYRRHPSTEVVCFLSRFTRAREYQKSGVGRKFAVAVSTIRAERSRCFSLAFRVDSEVVCDLVVCLSRRSGAVGAGRADRPLRSVEGAGDPCATSRTCDPAATVRSQSAGAGRPRLAGSLEPTPSTSGLADILGAAGDVVTLAPSAGGSALDVPAQAARPAVRLPGRGAS
jgi:hypothetical protein